MVKDEVVQRTEYGEEVRVILECVVASLRERYRDPTLGVGNSRSSASKWYCPWSFTLRTGGCLFQQVFKASCHGQRITYKVNPLT